ncbi:MAG: ribosome small subunit-dependent GTPase A [Clostridiales bacterium]|nr:ribosome small subunit-dependent GTPase A [Clostridiales bacterium]
MEGKITKGLGGIYSVRTSSGDTVSASARGIFRKAKITPTVGDNVIISPSGDPDVEYVIDKIEKRKNWLIRPPVANIDVLILCFAVKDPEPDLKLLDKMLIICGLLDIKPCIIFTKCDLNDEYGQSLFETYKKAGFDCFRSGIDEDIDPEEIIKVGGKNAIFGFAGPSGVGKSTLCNGLLEGDIMKVGDISDRLKRGKHTTRHVELFDFFGGFIMDTPGFTSLSLLELGVEYKSVILGYPEIAKEGLNCRFDDCRHASERDCSVIENIGVTIDEGRYSRYREFEEELYQKRNEYTGRKKFYYEQ